MIGNLTKTNKGWTVVCLSNEETYLLCPEDHPEMDSSRYEGKRVEFEKVLADYNDNDINDVVWYAKLNQPFNSDVKETKEWFVSPKVEWSDYLVRILNKIGRAHV